MNYSIIIPVYNRPEETAELLESLAKQTCKDFEVILVEDGSTRDCRTAARKAESVLSLKYIWKENSGPGPSRNTGAESASGGTLIFLDSDVVLPPDYVKKVAQAQASSKADAFGGPDRAHEDFTPTQKAISYAMTSFLTTGGIRGSRKRLDRFFPRSFNMGIRKEVFQSIGGFSAMRFGEDMDLSMRIGEGGYRTALFPDAWVWHKRRTDLRKFFRQVFNSGCARMVLTRKHPGTLKAVHLLPTAFTVVLALTLLALPACPAALAPVLFYAAILFLDALRTCRSLRVALLSVAASFVQLIGYGTGLLTAFWKMRVMGRRDPFSFRENFYK